MTTVGSGSYTYTEVRDWPKLPGGMTLGSVSAIATDSQDNVYIFNRKDPPVVVCDPDGNYINGWGNGAFVYAHGFYIAHDLVYLTDRDTSICMIYTLDGKPVKMLGQHGVHSDTGCERPMDPVPRPAGPFNYPSELVPSPWGDLYVSDGGGDTGTPGCTASTAAAICSSPGALGARPSPGSFTCPTASWWTRPTPCTFATGRTTECRCSLPTGCSWRCGKTSSDPWISPSSPRALS